MFGCPCYQINGKLFAFLVTNGVVLTHLNPGDRAVAADRRGAAAFRAGKKIVRSWVHLPIQDRKNLQQIIPLVRKNYEAAYKTLGSAIRLRP